MTRKIDPAWRERVTVMHRSVMTMTCGLRSGVLRHSMTLCRRHSVDPRRGPKFFLFSFFSFSNVFLDPTSISPTPLNK